MVSHCIALRLPETRRQHMLNTRAPSALHPFVRTIRLPLAGRFTCRPKTILCALSLL